MNDEEYRKLTRKIKGACVLALPQSAAKILELAKDPDSGPPEFAAAISVDLGLTSQILRFVNSSYFGFRSKITTIQMALSLVYGRTIRNFILWNAVFALLPNPKCGPFELKKICQDAMRRGIFARALASYFMELDAEELFICAMFQDMALPVLAQTWPVEYAEILGARQKDGKRLSEFEQAKFGWDHAIAGAFLVHEWGFDDKFADSIEAHTKTDFRFDTHTATPAQLRNAIVAVSSFLPSVLDDEWTEADRFLEGYFRVHRKGIPYPDSLFRMIDQQVVEMMAIAQLEQVPKTLIDFHRQYLTKMDNS